MVFGVVIFVILRCQQEPTHPPEFMLWDMGYLEWRSALAVYPAALLTWKPYRVERPGSDRPAAGPTLALFIHAAALYASLILISPY